MLDGTCGCQSWCFDLKVVECKKKSEKRRMSQLFVIKINWDTGTYTGY